MPDPRAVPEGEVRERLGRLNLDQTQHWQARARAGEAVAYLNAHVAPPDATLQLVGLRWDGTAYHDTEGSQE